MDTIESSAGNANKDSKAERKCRELPSNERDYAASLGVGFDGRFYRYRTYRYDLCSDAVRYAELDREKPQYRAKVIQPAPWESALEPTDKEERLMNELGIIFDGRYYRYEDYRYEQCADAANYAKLRNRDSWR